jgi:bacillithiol system protein YtxJ
MKFTALENETQLEAIKNAQGYQAVLKHNTTCPISKGVLASLQAGEEIEGLDALYVLDLLAHRPLSNTLAERYGVEHQSPQLLLIRNGKCVYDQFGYDISPRSIADALAD